MDIATLTKRSDFVKIAQKGNKAVAKGLVLQARAREDGCAADIRLGFTVTKKVGNAVIRNRIKRRLRTAAKEVLAQRGRTRYDYVVIGRKAAYDREYTGIIKDLKYALHEVHA